MRCTFALNADGNEDERREIALGRPQPGKAGMTGRKSNQAGIFKGVEGRTLAASS